MAEIETTSAIDIVRGIVKEQCHNIDPEFKTRMPDIWLSHFHPSFYLYQPLSA